MNHQWVAITIVPVLEVTVGKDPSKPPKVKVAEADPEDTQYGCSHCSIPLSYDTLQGACPGDN